jgi:beta-lactamase regulating signal transducer with metallopeptidase domain
VLGLGVSVLLRAPVTTIAADAAKPTTTVAPDATTSNTTSNVVLMEREVSKVASSQAARFDVLHRETASMSTQLKKVQADHANTIAQCKRDVWSTSWRVGIVGGSFLFIVLHLFDD